MSEASYTEAEVQLTRFGPSHLSIALPWFDDSDTQRWLGDRSWLIRAVHLRNEPSGIWFRGALQTGRYSWLAIDKGGEPVGYVDCGTFDRWVTYGGEGAEGAIILGTINRPSAAPALVVQPQRRRRGFGRAILRALVNYPELANIEVFGAGVDPANWAAIRCLETAGFRCESQQSDFEGMLYYMLFRGQGSELGLMIKSGSGDYAWLAGYRRHSTRRG